MRLHNIRGYVDESGTSRTEDLCDVLECHRLLRESLYRDGERFPR